MTNELRFSRVVVQYYNSNEYGMSFYNGLYTYIIYIKMSGNQN